MPKTIAYLADAPGAISWEEQEAEIALPGDVVFQAKKTGLHELNLRLRLRGLELEAGDTLKIHDLACVPLSTTKLLRTLTKLMSLGVNIHFVKPDIRLSASGQQVMGPFLEALSKHEAGIKKARNAPPAPPKLGRPIALNDDQAKEIQEKSRTGASIGELAETYSVSKSTIYHALKRKTG